MGQNNNMKGSDKNITVWKFNKFSKKKAQKIILKMRAFRGNEEKYTTCVFLRV